MKASGRNMLLALAGASLLAIASGARAGDDKDTSGRLVTWNVLKDGKEVIGSESLRLVKSDSGMVFASGEIRLKTGKKLHKKSHLQRDTSGRLVKYQRVEAGLKGPGLRLFEWQGQMRVAPINASGKPADVGVLDSARIWDAGLWHLYATWGLPTACEGASFAYFDPQLRVAGQAELSCAGGRKLWDDKGQAVAVNRFRVAGVAGEAVELWVDGKGELLGVTSATRTMLRAKHALEGGKPEDGDGEEAPVNPDTDAIKDRGVGE